MRRRPAGASLRHSESPVCRSNFMSDYSNDRSGPWISHEPDYVLGTLRQSLANVEHVKLSAYIDARLADTHILVHELDGPFDFVFSDADKDWYTQYFEDVDTKLIVDGCFTGHNVLSGFAGAETVLHYVREQPNYVTTIDRTSRAGISISCKTSH